MSITVTMTLAPNAWSVVSTLASIHMLQVKDRKSIRLHFGDIRNPPAFDSEDFILMSDYNPKPLAIEYMNLSYPQACLFARPDGVEPAKVTAVLLKTLTPAIFPASGALVPAKVNFRYWRRFELHPSSYIPFVEYTVVSGALPSEFLLSLDGEMTGKPVAPGSYAFTIRAEYEGGSATAAYTLVVSA